MSITLFINKDTDKSVIQEHDCYCLEFQGQGHPDPNCAECQGSGMIRFENSQWEINLSNSNMGWIFNVLKLDFDHGGSMSADTLLEAIAKKDVALYLSLGKEGEYLHRVFTQMKKIAEEAKLRNEQINWG